MQNQIIRQVLVFACQLNAATTKEWRFAFQPWCKIFKKMFIHFHPPQLLGEF